MERFKVYMYDTNPNKDRIIRILCGVMGIIGIFAFYILRSDYFTLFLSIIFLIGAAGYKKFIKRNFILVDDEGIKAEFAYLDLVKLRHLIPPYLRRLDKVYVKWEDIQSVSKEPLKITIVLNNDSQKEIYIGDLSYKDHQKLREKLQEYIEAKGITTAI